MRMSPRGPFERGRDTKCCRETSHLQSTTQDKTLNPPVPTLNYIITRWITCNLAPDAFIAYYLAVLHPFVMRKKKYVHTKKKLLLMLVWGVHLADDAAQKVSLDILHINGKQ